MRNFAEELAYWYFRLNGFFPISDFVQHRSRPMRSSDCDIVAVRPPHVYEEVGGQTLDWDERFKKHFELGRTIGMICEVKGGNENGRSALSETLVRQCLKRLGFVPEKDVEQYVTKLNENSFVDVSASYRIIKVFIGNKELHNTMKAEYINLSEVKTFIKERMKRHIQKQSDWTFLQSSIIQEIIWEVRLEREKQGRVQSSNSKRERKF